MSGRKTRVKVNGSYAEWSGVLSRVSQGSVLGPFLFLLIIDDFPNWIKSSIKMFADDSKMWRVIKDEVDKETLQSDLDKLIEWCDKWLLEFN